MTTNGTAMTVHNQNDGIQQAREYDGLSMVVSPAEALRRVQELQAFVRSVMVRGTDYGVIPGAGDKPTLFQPGAQKLLELYGFAFSFQDATAVEDWERAFFFYRKRCVVTSRRDGRFICDGIGSCNSREDRYAYRWVKRDQVPKGIDQSTLKSKDTKYGARYRVPNDDIYSLVNTIEKMACKRALVMATIGATRSSGIFTQDVEDLPAEVFGEESSARSWEAGKVADGEFEPVQQAQSADPEAATFDALAATFGQRIGEAQTREELASIGQDIKRASMPRHHVDALKATYNARSEALRAAAAA